MNIIEEYTEQFRKEYKNYVEDGIIDLNKWNELSCNDEHILFLLKEAYIKNDEVYNWSLPKWIIRDKANPCCDLKFCTNKVKGDCVTCKLTGKTYNHVAEYVYAIKQVKNGCYEFDKWLGVKNKDINQYYKKRDELLREVAIVNVKKGEGKSISSHSELSEIAKRDALYLRNQILSISPSLIICGGTYFCLEYIFEDCLVADKEKIVSEIITENSKIKAIKAYHPNYRISSERKFNYIVENYKKLGE